MMIKTMEKRQKRANLVNQARDLISRAEQAGRYMDAEEEKQYNAIMDDVSKLKTEIDREEQLNSLESEMQNSLHEPIRPNAAAPAEEETNPRNTNEYKAAFGRYLRSGLRSLTTQEFKAMQATDDTGGGYLIAPQQFTEQILKRVDDLVFMRQLATVEKLTKSESLGIPTLESDPADADWTTELRTGSETDMTFGKRELRPHPMAKRIKISNKLIRISAVPVEALARDRFAYKFGITQEKAYLLGDGVDKPLGIFTASTDGISTSRDVSNGNTATDITFDGLKSAKYALKVQYRNSKSIRWMFHRNAMEMIDKIKDNDGQYIWQPGTQVGAPDMILGIPVTESEYIPNTFTTGKYVGILGDFSYYHIVDALEMQVQRLVELYAETNQTGLIARYEGDGMPVLEEAFARVKLG